METKVVEESTRIVEKYNELFLEQYRVWLKDIVFTWQWWFELIVITTLPWVVWLIFRKKEQTHRLLYAGFFVLIAACFLDMVVCALPYGVIRISCCLFCRSMFRGIFVRCRSALCCPYNLRPK